VAFLEFLGSQAGRGVGVVAGLALIATGVILRGGWLAVAVVGVLPLIAGVFDVCVLGPLLRLPFTAATAGSVAAVKYHRSGDRRARRRPRTSR
jgi:hypothetical protein